jgi:metal-responsive CopG/Arc/MetJ family transcriptional regulator
MIVSGNHRVSAYLAEYEKDHEIDVIVKQFKNRAEVLKEFARENLTHGKPFSGNEKRQTIIELMKHNVTPEACAQLFNLNVKRIENYAGMAVMVIDRGCKEEPKAIKHGIEHLSGQKMEADKYREHLSSDRGISCAAQAKQLTRWLCNGWINTDNENDMAALVDLRDALEVFFDQKKVAVG